MAKKCRSIRWPQCREEAVRLYVRFVVEVLEVLDLDLIKSPDPIMMARKYLAGDLELEELCSLAELFGDYLVNRMLGDNNLESNVVRLAICLTSVGDDVDLGERLGELIEILYAIDVKYQDYATDCYYHFFAFEDAD